MPKNNKSVVIHASGYNGHEPVRACPHCHKKKPVSQYGFRKTNSRGNAAVQSWCKKCRSKA